MQKFWLNFKECHSNFPPDHSSNTIKSEDQVHVPASTEVNNVTPDTDLLNPGHDLW